MNISVKRTWLVALLLAMLLFVCALAPVAFAAARAEGDAEYVQQLKKEYDLWNKTDVFELREEGMYMEWHNPDNSGINFSQTHLKEKPFSLSFRNPVYAQDGSLLDKAFYRTQVQITLKEKGGNNYLRFNFKDGSGTGGASELTVHLVVDNAWYNFTLPILGNMTRDWEYQICFDYFADDMIFTRVVNSVPTDVFKTASYDISAFNANVAGETVQEKTEYLRSLIKTTFAQTVCFEPYIQIWGDLGGSNSQRKLVISEHNGQRFDGGAAYAAMPYIGNFHQTSAVVENTSFRVSFTGSTDYLVDPNKFVESKNPGYMPDLYAMIERDAVQGSNIKDISCYLASSGGEEACVHSGTGWNTAAIDVGAAGDYTLRTAVTNDAGAVYERSVTFSVVKAERLELQGELPALWNEGEKLTFPAADAVTASGTTQGIEPAVTYAEDEKSEPVPVSLEELTVAAALPGFYTATYTQGELTLQKTVHVLDESEQLVGLQINKPPTKLLYTAGESFDDMGLMIQKKYANGRLEEIWGGYFVVTDKPLALSDRAAVIGLTENGVTAYMVIPIAVEGVVITELAVENVAIVTPCKLTYVAGEQADLAGLSVRVTFNDGTQTVVNGGFTLRTLSPLQVGDDAVEAAFTVGDFELSVRVPVVVDAAVQPEQTPSAGEVQESGCGAALTMPFAAAAAIASAGALLVTLRRRKEK